MAARRVEQVRDTKRYCLRLRLSARAMFVLLGLSISLLASRSATVMIVVTLLLMSAFCTCIGFNLSAYSILFSKTVRSRKRGTVLGIGGAVSGKVAVCVGLGVPRILRADAPWGGVPNGYALCFGVGGLVMLCQFITTVLIQEPPGLDRPNRSLFVNMSTSCGSS